MGAEPVRWTLIGRDSPVGRVTRGRRTLDANAHVPDRITVEELRKPKRDSQNRNKLNIMAQARGGLRAIDAGTCETRRDVDFVALRRALVANTRGSDEWTASIQPKARKS